MKTASGDLTTFVYIGNWDRYKSPTGNGFGICSYDVDTGNLTLLKSVFPNITVGAACRHPHRDILYCTDEYDTLPGNFLGGGGQVYALAIDPETGDLTEVNHCPSFGSLPSSLTVDAHGDYLLVTHHTDRVPVTKIVSETSGKFQITLEYDDATTVLFPLRQDGSIGEPYDVYKHSGSGGPLPRQTHPQLHSVKMVPSGNLFVVCDKGNDECVLFGINRNTQKLDLLGSGFKSIPGSSPRYTAFHPTRPYMFVNHETKAIVSSVRYNDDGQIDLICTVDALPQDIGDDLNMKQSDIVIHPSGKHLYSMVRGIHAISIFDVNGKTGEITRNHTVTLDGTGPRGCAISPDGRFMLIAMLTSHDVRVWTIANDGSLSPTGITVPQPNPGTVTFWQGRRSRIRS
jgi:6-phosphogluconolactonase (cycloisomerase 2 family)